MNQQGKLLFLGTGGSLGIPVIGCNCAVCHSQSRQDSRTRPGVLLSIHQKKILIDAGPDYRSQALRHKIDHLDGVMITHSHHDHTAGLDDLRIYSMRSQKPLPCLMSIPTAEDLTMRYAYMFRQQDLPYKLTPQLSQVVLDDKRGKTDFLGVKIGYFTYEQAKMPVNGFRVGNLGFVTDIRNYPETIFDDLEGIEVLVLSALRFSFSELHFNVDEAIDFSRKVRSKQTWLTHIAHELDHEKTNAYLPQNIRLAYDGLEIQFEG